MNEKCIFLQKTLDFRGIQCIIGSIKAVLQNIVIVVEEYLMKKIVAALLATVMAASLFAGCGNKNAAVNITKAEDLEGKKIGVQAGTTGETYVTESVKDAKVQSFKSGMDAALDLKNGAIDAIVLDELPAKAIVEQNPDLAILDCDLATEEYAIAVKKGNTELLEKINATIQRIKTDGTYESMVNAFMPADGEIKIPEHKATEGDTVIKMGTNAAFPPFEYVEGSEVVGFDITMSEEIAADMGAKLQVEDMNFDSLLSALSSDVIDFAAAGMSITEERLKSVDFSEPYYSSKQVIILKK